MNIQQKEQEHERLRLILFEGAPEEVTHAVYCDVKCQWLWCKGKPKLSYPTMNNPMQGKIRWSGWFKYTKNQPETDLHSLESLIER